MVYQCLNKLIWSISVELRGELAWLVSSWYLSMLVVRNLLGDLILLSSRKLAVWSSNSSTWQTCASTSWLLGELLILLDSVGLEKIDGHFVAERERKGERLTIGSPFQIGGCKTLSSYAKRFHPF